MFDRLPAVLAHAMLSIPATKGFEVVLNPKPKQELVVFFSLHFSGWVGLGGRRLHLVT